MVVRLKRLTLFLSLLLTGASVIGSTPGVSEAQETTRAADDCRVTPYAAEGLADSFSTTWYGGGDFWAGPDRSYRGIWYAGSEGMKVQWRLPHGTALTVEGARRDATAPPLQAKIANGYEGYPYQVSRLFFPTEGCWEVTGRIADQELQFVVWVHPETDDPYVTNPSTPSANTWVTLHRPLKIPAIQPDESCPTSTVQQIPRMEGDVLGDGPIYAQGLGIDGTIPLGGVPMRGDAYSIPIRWVATPEASGPFLIRGVQRDSGEPLVFGDTDPQSEVQVWDITSQGSPDWQVWQGANLRLSGPGCFGLQIDSVDFTEVIFFVATEEIAPIVTSPQP
jgi:hypothetical protein